jgi:hypothetical protein
MTGWENCQNSTQTFVCMYVCVKGGPQKPALSPRPLKNCTQTFAMPYVDSNRDHNYVMITMATAAGYI